MLLAVAIPNATATSCVDPVFGSVAVDVRGNVIVSGNFGNWRTSDDGVTWLPAPPLADDSRTFWDRIFQAPHGAVYRNALNQAHPEIQISRDRGKAWRPLQIPGVARDAVAIGVEKDSLYFFGGNPLVVDPVLRHVILRGALHVWRGGNAVEELGLRAGDPSRPDASGRYPHFAAPVVAFASRSQTLYVANAGNMLVKRPGEPWSGLNSSPDWRKCNGPVPHLK